MNKLSTNKIILFAIALIILFGLPLYTIVINNATLKGGTEYLFKVRAFDPYDMFRGNYLNINFEENTVYSNNDFSAISNATYYVTLSQGENGFAYFSSISKTKPEGSNYYKTTAACYWGDHCTVHTPTRYYMNEKKSLRAEEIYGENAGNTHIKVRVKNGQMVIVGVYVNGVLIDTIE